MLINTNITFIMSYISFIHKYGENSFDVISEKIFELWNF